MKILAIDDDELTLELVTLLLLQTGDNEVDTALGSTEALKALNRADPPYDCLLIDIQMPGLNGIELCDAVRRMPRYGECPILMLTSLKFVPFLDRAFAAGATDYITKPFEVNDLTARVARAQEHHARLKRQRRDEVFRPLRLSAIPNAVNFSVLPTYIEQLSRVGQDGSWIFAVKIERIIEHHARTAPMEFVSLINRVAEALTHSLGRESFVLSYAGEGHFLCVLHDPRPLERVGLERRLQAFLAQTETGGQAHGIEAVVGTPMRPRLSSGMGARALVRRALDRAEARSAAPGLGLDIARLLGST